MNRALKRLWKDRSGSVAIEYPLLMALLAVGLISGLIQLGGSVGQMFSTAAGAMSPAVAASADPAPPPEAPAASDPEPAPPPEEEEDDD
jgi:Flp pilus assembly pilin Flp